MMKQTLDPTPSERAAADAIAGDIKDTAAALAAETTQLLTPVRDAEGNIKVVIGTDSDYTAAGELLVGVKRAIIERRDRFKGPKQKAHEAHRAVCDLERDLLAPLLATEQALDVGMVTYRMAQQRLRDDAERQARLHAEEEERQRRTKEIADLEAHGDDDAAAELAAAPLFAVPAPLPPQVGHVPKVDGLTPTERWHAEVFDRTRFIRWVAQDVETRGHLVEANMEQLNKAAQSQRRALQIPGVKPVPSATMTRRGR
jgi:hypothetical protein